MSIPAVSRNNFTPVEERRHDNDVKLKDSDQHIARICGHFFMTCAAISGIAFAASGNPAALASFVICLICATACYLPNHIFVYRGPSFWPRQHYVPRPVTPPVVVGGGPTVVVDTRPRHPVGGSHFVANPAVIGGGAPPVVVVDPRPRHQVGGNHAPPAQPQVVHSGGRSVGAVHVNPNERHQVGGNHGAGGARHQVGGNRRFH